MQESKCSASDPEQKDMLAVVKGNSLSLLLSGDGAGADVRVPNPLHNQRRRHKSCHLPPTGRKTNTPQHCKAAYYSPGKVIYSS